MQSSKIDADDMTVALLRHYVRRLMSMMTPKGGGQHVHEDTAKQRVKVKKDKDEPPARK
jgi:hypothetical protein